MANSASPKTNSVYIFCASFESIFFWRNGGKLFPLLSDNLSQLLITTSLFQKYERHSRLKHPPGKNNFQNPSQARSLANYSNNSLPCLLRE